MCPSESPDSNCQSARELQISPNNGEQLLLHHQQPPPVLPSSLQAQKRRKAFAGGGQAGQTGGQQRHTVELGLTGEGMREVRYNAEEAAEVAILSRDCMKHLGDWYYPESGWGWVVFLCCLLTSSLSLGLVLGAGHDLLAAISRRVLAGTWSQTWGLLVVAGCLSSAQLSSPLATHLCLTRSPRLCAFIGSITMSLAWLFTSFATELHQILISYSILLGLGVSLVRAASSVMVGQYFRRRRLHLEVLLHSWSGPGLSLGSVLLSCSLQGAGWSLGLQIVAASVSLCILCSLLYRPASVYHPQREAILHLRKYMRQFLGKSRYKPRSVLDVLRRLKDKTVRLVLLCGLLSSVCLYTPILVGVSQARQAAQLSQSQLGLLQLLLGLAFGLGSYCSGRLCMRGRGRKPCAVIIFSGGLGLLVVQGLSSLLPLSLLLSALLAGIISCANTVFLYRSARWDSLRHHTSQTSQTLHVTQLDYICCTFPSQTQT